ncbi:MAG: RimJ/RimL family protein N-acetyltransferase, partial [Luteibaculaceae bacterium]
TNLTEKPSLPEIQGYLMLREKLLKDGQERFIIGKENAPLGTLDFFEWDPSDKSAGIGIALFPEQSRGKGYGKDALKLGLEWFFKFGECLVAEVQEWNTTSIAFFTKMGFQKMGKIATDPGIGKWILEKEVWLKDE